MQKRQLGQTGLSIAPIVFGGNVFGWTADEKTSFDLLDGFFGAGFNTIDTADVYSRWVEGHKGGESETIIGKWLKSGPRDRAIVVTKVGMDMGQGKPDLSRKWIIEEVENSLRRLQTDYIDLYLAHTFDPQTPQEESLAAFAQLKEEGKIRAFGCSNFDANQLQASFDISGKEGYPRYDVIQPEYNLYTRDRFEGDLADLCLKENIGVISYFALASGFLTGKYRSPDDVKGAARGGRVGTYFDERGQRILAALDEVAKETGAKPASVAIAWVAAKPAVTAPIASATSLSQLDSLVAAGRLELSAAQVAHLDQAGT